MTMPRTMCVTIDERLRCVGETMPIRRYTMFAADEVQNT
jgi:hypothetical protein